MGDNLEFNAKKAKTLDEIIAFKKAEIERRRLALPLELLQDMAEEQPSPLSLKNALRGGEISLIAEVKKASPSRGVIRANFDPVAIARAYADGGAAAISVLTEDKYFQGSLDYLAAIKKATGRRLPLLRKDFVIDPYQVYASRAYGADAILLIVAILTPEKLAGLLALSRSLGMDCLVEVHNEPELKIALAGGAGIIGINNRDLKTFQVDTKTTGHLRPLIPHDKIVVSESGIKSQEDIEAMKKLGIDAVLIGEALMTAPDIAGKMRELLG
jgi:indole-3-glycerol phosphate synthase